MDKENWVQEWWCRGMKVGFKWYIELIWVWREIVEKEFEHCRKHLT